MHQFAPTMYTAYWTNHTMTPYPFLKTYVATKNWLSNVGKLPICRLFFTQQQDSNPGTFNMYRSPI